MWVEFCGLDQAQPRFEFGSYLIGGFETHSLRQCGSHYWNTTTFFVLPRFERQSWTSLERHFYDYPRIQGLAIHCGQDNDP